MTDTYFTLKKVIDATNVDHLVTNKAADELLAELYTELVPKDKINENLWIAAKLEPTPVVIPVFNVNHKQMGTAEVVDGHIRVYIEDTSAWAHGRRLSEVTITMS